MSTEIKLHKIQSDILCQLALKPSAGFAELNSGEVTNDHFSFHIKKMVANGLVEKNEGKYKLTDKGKALATRFDIEKQEYEKQAKIGVLIVCKRQNKGRTEYLAHHRLKAPFYGFYGFITGKITSGEQVIETATRELLEETGYKADLALVGIQHKMDYDKHKMLEDKFFFIFKAENPRGDFISEFPGGRNIWMTEEEIMAIPQLFDGVDEALKLTKQNKMQFLETKYQVRGF